MRAPRNAARIVSVYCRASGVNEVTYQLTDNSKAVCLYYHPYPKKVDMAEPRDLLVELWKDLDYTVDRIRSGSEISTNYLKAYANGIALCIQKIMSPFYPDVKAVSQEALARSLARERNEPHDTPGLAESIWDPSTRFDGTPYSVDNEKKARAGVKVTAAPKATGNRVPDTAMATCKQGIEMGMFTVSQMAKSYNMTEQELKDQLGLV